MSGKARTLVLSLTGWGAAMAVMLAAGMLLGHDLTAGGGGLAGGVDVALRVSRDALVGMAAAMIFAICALRLRRAQVVNRDDVRIRASGLAVDPAHIARWRERWIAAEWDATDRLGEPRRSR